MSKHANPTLVGGFVVGAVVLVVAGFLIFGNRSLFAQEFKYVAYFESSITGLDEGAAVRYQGVQVGHVSRISAVWAGDEEILIPVELTFSRESVQAPTSQLKADLERRGVRDIMDSLIERGLRATLVQDSFLTGKMHVALSYYPGSEARIVGGSKLPEMPTIKSGLAQRIEELPIDELVHSALETVRTVEALARHPAAAGLLEKLDTLIARVDAHVDPLASSTQGVVVDLHNTLAELRNASADLRRLIQDTGSRIGSVSEAATGVLDESRATFANVNELVSEKDVIYRLIALLDDLSASAQALRVLAETLEREPEALIKGKGDR